MRSLFIEIFTFMFCSTSTFLLGHCQMPCGIYDDQMIYDKVDQYFLTMTKAVRAMNNNDFKTVQDKNQFVRWVMTKDKESDDVASLLTTYFLQQKIGASDEPETAALIKSIHQLLFLLVQIKQNVDLAIVHEFGKEWDHFKELFHPEVECHKVMHAVEEEKKASSKEGKVKEKAKPSHYHTHDHDHSHSHPHTH